MTVNGLIVAFYPPLILAAMWVSFCFAIWWWHLRHDDDKRTRRFLVMGIALSFAALAAEKSLILYELLTHNADDSSIYSSRWEIVAATLFKVGIWVGAIVHLHAMWVASFGRSYWVWFSFGSVLVFLAGLYLWG